MTKYARVIISGDGLDYRVTVRHYWAALIIQFIAKIDRTQLLSRKPVKKHE